MARQTAALHPAQAFVVEHHWEPRTFRFDHHCYETQVEPSQTRILFLLEIHMYQLVCPNECQSVVSLPVWLVWGWFGVG
jgi:hypothetical protein